VAACHEKNKHTFTRKPRSSLLLSTQGSLSVIKAKEVQGKTVLRGL
jgi:hypothetical protein